MADRVPWLSAQGIFYALCVWLSGLLLVGSAITARSPAGKWRTIWEVSLLALIGSSLVHNHYYYLIVLLVPLGALAYRYWMYRGRLLGVKAALLCAAYVLLSAFVVPISLSSRLLRADVWELYIVNALYLYGILILMGLVSWEYVSVLLEARQERPALAAAATQG